SAPPLPQFYADSAVVAYRLPDCDHPFTELQPKITSSGGTFDLAALTDGDLTKSTLLPAAPVGERSWIQVEFPQRETIYGLNIVIAAGGGRGGRGGGEAGQTIESSDDGRQFRAVSTLVGGSPSRTISFAPVTARYFRVSFLTPQPPAGRG